MVEQTETRGTSTKQVSKNVYDDDEKAIRVLLNENTKTHQAIISNLRSNNELLYKIMKLLEAIGE